LILSMRGVPMVDVSSVHAFERLSYQQKRIGGRLLISGLQPQVRRKFEKAGLVEELGEDAFFWSADQAILKASNNGILDDTGVSTPPRDMTDGEPGASTSPMTAASVTP
jgi:hypothetical protein